LKAPRRDFRDKSCGVALNAAMCPTHNACSSAVSAFV